MLLFILQIEPLLVALERELRGLHVGLAREASFGNVDDVSALGSDFRDLATMDRLVADYEKDSSAILNRNHKSVIVGLGPVGRLPGVAPCLVGNRGRGQSVWGCLHCGVC